MRVTGWLCLAENMPSGTAIRPNDVLRIHGGTTVEVLNTDAEGRLVLADGLVAASDEHPDAIVDVATLTGAQVVALGHRIAGLMGDDALRRARARRRRRRRRVGLADAAPRRPASRAEVGCRRPREHEARQTVPGMLFAGVFLREFVGHEGRRG